MSPPQTEFNLIISAISNMKSDIRSDIAGIHNRLDLLNGRTREVEKSTAVYKAFFGIIGSVLAVMGAAILRLWF